MRYLKAVFRPARIDRAPGHLATSGEHGATDGDLAASGDHAATPGRSLLLSIVGFFGCVVCLGWNVLHDSRPTGQLPEHFGYGRAATQHEIDSEAIAIAPDGRGLPAGSGNSVAGAQVYKLKCAACHGATGAEGPFQKLVGDTGKVKTIGNYWPYATTVFDYIRRAMPLNAPGTLKSDEVYGITAYLLSANRIISPDAVLDARTLPAVEMPAKNLFVAHGE